MSNSQLNKLKFVIKNGAEITLNISSNIVADSNNENKFSHKLLLTSTQVSKLRKAFADGLSANMKLSKIQLPKIGKSGEFLGKILRLLLKTGLSLIGNVLKPLAESALIWLGLKAAASAKDAAIHKKWLGLVVLWT